MQGQLNETVEHWRIRLNEAIGLNGADFSPQQTMQRPQNDCIQD